MDDDEDEAGSRVVTVDENEDDEASEEKEEVCRSPATTSVNEVESEENKRELEPVAWSGRRAEGEDIDDETATFSCTSCCLTGSSCSFSSSPRSASSRFPRALNAVSIPPIVPHTSADEPVAEDEDEDEPNISGNEAAAVAAAALAAAAATAATAEGLRLKGYC